jgi:Na+-driven multidrug efflux pump
MVVVLWVLAFRDRLLASLWPGYHELLASWKTILRMGLPVAVSNAIIPVALGLLTRIVTGFGAEAVAGFGVATRIEGFGLALVYALSTGLSPFVGQNFGAGRIDRIEKGLFLSKMFCLAWGVLLLVVFLLLGKWFAAYFDSDPAVIRAASLYLWIVSISLGLRSVHHIIWTALNVLGRPYDALILEFLLAFGLWIPLAFAGAHIAAIAGVFGGLSVANIVGGVTAYIWIDRVTARQRRERETLTPADAAVSE